MTEYKERIQINTKSNHPFIYFFVEPNIVFVFRIETENYVTVSNLFENGEWETYEIQDEFEFFHHEKSNPHKGSGFSISMDYLNPMVEEINKHIQHQRQISLSSESKMNMLEQHGVYHIVTSESAASSLRFALPRPKTVIGFPDFFSIGPLWKLEE